MFLFLVSSLCRYVPVSSATGCVGCGSATVLVNWQYTFWNVNWLGQTMPALQCRPSRLGDSLSPVLKLEREAIVGSLADAGPTDGRNNLQGSNLKHVTQKHPLRR